MYIVILEASCWLQAVLSKQKAYKSCWHGFKGMVPPTLTLAQYVIAACSLGIEMQVMTMYLDDLRDSAGIGFASCRLFILLQSDVGEAHEKDQHQQYTGNVSNDNGAFVAAWLT